MIRYKKRKDGCTPCDIYRPGSAKYYRDVLSNVSAIGMDYDGFNPRSAKQMKSLVDDIVKIVDSALNHKPQYVSPGEPTNVRSDNGRDTRRNIKRA